MMQAPQQKPQAGGPGAGMSASGRQFQSNDSRCIERLQYRLAGFALALDAVLPDVAFLESAVQLTALELPLPAGGQVRLHKLALRLFDLRVILEEPLPEVRR